MLSNTPLGLGIRSEFPIYSRSQGKALAYLDTAASSHKPRQVIKRLHDYLAYEHANIHRGAYELSAVATANYSAAREKVAKFINAPSQASVIFTRGTTESINLVAQSWGEQIKPGSSILLTLLEHHSNIVPWQLLAKRRGLNLHFADLNDDGSLKLEDFRRLLKEKKPAFVAMTQISNALGSLVPVQELCAEAHQAGALVLVDVAQSVVHSALDVQKLDADFAVFSGHKLYGPTGIGILYGREKLLNQMEPYQGGGGMIRLVTPEGSSWAELPEKFEAGTPSIAEAIAFGTAIDFVNEIGMPRIAAHEDRLFHSALERLLAEPGVHIHGPAASGGRQASIISFTIDGVHAHDFATIADSFNVQLRAGHHCAMPALKRLGIQASIRASFGMYSDTQDVDVLIEAIRAARQRLA